MLTCAQRTRAVLRRCACARCDVLPTHVSQPAHSSGSTRAAQALAAAAAATAAAASGSGSRWLALAAARSPDGTRSLRRRIRRRRRHRATAPRHSGQRRRTLGGGHTHRWSAAAIGGRNAFENSAGGVRYRTRRPQWCRWTASCRAEAAAAVSRCGRARWRVSGPATATPCHRHTLPLRWNGAPAFLLAPAPAPHWSARGTRAGGPCSRSSASDGPQSRGLSRWVGEVTSDNRSGKMRSREHVAPAARSSAGASSRGPRRPLGSMPGQRWGGLVWCCRRVIITGTQRHFRMYLSTIKRRCSRIV